jgi:hypothetical protein
VNQALRDADLPTSCLGTGGLRVTIEALVRDTHNAALDAASAVVRHYQPAYFTSNICNDIGKLKK